MNRKKLLVELSGENWMKICIMIEAVEKLLADGDEETQEKYSHIIDIFNNLPNLKDEIMEQLHEQLSFKESIQLAAKTMRHFFRNDRGAK